MEATSLMRQYKVDILNKLPKTHECVFKWFLALTELNRPSFETAEAMKAVISWFTKMGCEHEVDSYGNAIFRKKASKGKESVKSVCLQGHLDIVAVGQFEEGGKVPVKLEDGYLKSGVSTLGADDGIAVAIMLAVCEKAETFEHGPLEFLVTLDEEVGLLGATRLKGPPFIQSSALINLDSEEWGIFFTSCAGGVQVYYEYIVKREDFAGETLKVTVSNFVSGHTGASIHVGNANAVKWMARCLENARDSDFRLVTWNGGVKHNVIPDKCEVVVVVHDVATFRKKMEEAHNWGVKEYKALEKYGPKIEFESVKCEQKPMTASDSQKVVDFMMTQFHGVMMMHPEIENLVNTSQALAVTRTDGDKVFAQVFARSNESSQIPFLVNYHEAYARLTGWTARIPKDEIVGPWPAALESRIMDVTVSVYERLYGKKPEITGIHAGLECGCIQNMGYSNLECISFGPDLQDPHTVKEKVSVDTCCKCYDLTLESLKEWAK